MCLDLECWTLMQHRAIALLLSQYRGILLNANLYALLFFEDQLTNLSPKYWALPEALPDTGHTCILQILDQFLGSTEVRKAQNNTTWHRFVVGVLLRQVRRIANNINPNGDGLFHLQRFQTFWLAGCKSDSMTSLEDDSSQLGSELKILAKGSLSDCALGVSCPSTS
ncbi:hypothetical protein Tco_0044397 [Tanacetum coccineum]